MEYAVTQGFNQHLKAAFGPALPVGTAGENEYYDVWLTRYTEAGEALARLQASTAPDLAPVEARYVPASEPSLTAALTIARYVVGIEGKGSTAEQVREALESVIAAGELSVEHKGKTKVFDLARSVPEDARVAVAENGMTTVSVTVRMGAEGSLRPEHLVKAAIAASVLDATVAHVTRTDLLVETPSGEWSRPV